MSITPLPTPPSRGNDASTFSTRADALLGALPTFVDEANALETNVVAKEASATAAATNAASAETGANTSALAATTRAQEAATSLAQTQTLADQVSADRAAVEAAIQAGPVLSVNGMAGLVTITAADLGVTPAVQDFQEFLAAGTWTKPANASWVYVEAIAGGGAGASSVSGGAGGASGGEFVSQLFRASELGATESVVVGAGAVGPAAGTTATGGNGGDSSFGAHLTAKGGRGGSGNGVYLSPLPRSGLVTPYNDGSSAVLGMLCLPQAGYGGAVATSGGSPASAAGGNTIYGGAGGGAGGGVSFGGGISQRGGNGGAGGNGVAGASGSVPGGGGGGGRGGGNGGNGRIRVWCW